MSETENQTEFYFDVQSGQLLIGRLAVDTHIEAGGDPADIHALPDLLAGPERVVGPKVFKPIPYAEWNSKDDVPTVQWLHGVVAQYSPEKVLSEEVVTRAGYLDLVPRLHYFKTRESGLVGLYRDASLEGTRTRTLFDSWTTQDFVNYIRRLAKEKGDKPIIDDIIYAARQPGNPSPIQINGRFDNLGVLFELAGYVYVKNWSRDDFISWGMRFMEANDGQIPTAPAMDFLSARHLGPNHSAIYDGDEFTSILDFQTEVMFAYEERQKYKKELREQHLLAAKRLAKTGPIFIKRMALRTGEDDELLRVSARYRLLKIFAPDLDNRTKRQISIASPPESLITTILEANDAVTAEDVEKEARRMWLHDTIWPDPRLQTLKIA